MAEQEGTIQLGLNGRLVTAYDATKLISSDDSGQVVDFKTLKNMRYTNRGIKGVPGMTKINTTALTGYEKIRSMYHFEKEQPHESHVIAQGFNSAETSSRLYDNTAAVPAQGDFGATYLHEEAAGAGIGRFSSAPQSHMCYCNNLETLVWGGDEVKLSAFMIYDEAGGAFNYDYSSKVQNSKTDAGNIATIANDATPKTTIYIGNTLPISGIKFYTGVANTTPGTMTVKYWNGSSYQGVANPVDDTDNTANGGTSGTPLSATSGWFTFDGTGSVAKVSFRNGVYAYWYQVQIASGAADVTTTITQCTVGEDMQVIKDFWDGNLRGFISVHTHDGTQLQEQTTNVAKNEYIYVSGGGDTSSYMDLSTLPALGSGGYLVVGSFFRMMGFHVKFIPGNTNTTAATTIAVHYWDGSAWAALTTSNDGTSEGSISFTRSGFVTWQARDENEEFRRSLIGEELIYYYRISFDKALSSSVLAYYIAGIPVQETISSYKFSLHAKNRLLLFSDRKGDKNSMIHSAINTLNVFNGEDSGEPLHFGDGTESVAAVELFTRFFSSIKSVIVVCKRNSTHVLEGDNPKNWSIVDISNKVGCVAPNTMKTSSIGLEVESLQPRHVAIWLHSSGVYTYDSQTINIISDDIADLFDQSATNAATNAINLTYIANSTGEFTVVDGEHYYHLCMPIGSTATTLNSEFVYDLKRRKWFTIDRTTGKYFQAITGVKSAAGNAYAYGSIDTGYIERMWNGDDFDGEAIHSAYQIGDIAINRNNMMVNSKILKVVHPMVAKSITPNTIKGTHYADTDTDGYKYELEPYAVNKRVAIPTKGFSSKSSEGVFHSLKHEITTDEERIGFEPLYLGVKYRVLRERT